MTEKRILDAVLTWYVAREFKGPHNTNRLGAPVANSISAARLPSAVPGDIATATSDRYGCTPKMKRVAGQRGIAVQRYVILTYHEGQGSLIYRIRHTDPICYVDIGTLIW